MSDIQNKYNRMKLCPNKSWGFLFVSSLTIIYNKVNKSILIGGLI